MWLRTPRMTHITTSVIFMLPTSRGSIKLADSNPQSAALVDPNYMATETDRYILREGMRKLYHIFRQTEAAGRAIIDSKVLVMVSKQSLRRLPTKILTRKSVDILGK